MNAAIVLTLRQHRSFRQAGDSGEVLMYHRLYHQCPACQGVSPILDGRGRSCWAGGYWRKKPNLVLLKKRRPIILRVPPAAEAKRAMKRSNPMKLVGRVGAAHPLDRC